MMNHFLRISCCVLLSVSLGACSANKKSEAEKDRGPVKTVANTGYRTPSLKGPVPRNPDMNLPANFNGTALTISRGLTDRPIIAMTFDDGPNPRNTPRLLDMLRQRNIKATFYVIGKNVAMYPQVVRRTVAEGHEIGNHTWDHRLLTKMSNAQVLSELTRTRDAVAKAAGVVPRTLRPPYGALSQRQRQFVHEQLGYPTVLWSVDPLDWKRPGPSVVADRIVSRANNGAIILSHDLHSQTVDAMPQTLDRLLRKGFKFVTVSQMIAMKEAVSVAAAQKKPPVPADGATAGL
jgi:peptidoglycan/xylan/chitin deacetylase (PgdA/CDA1 family)